MKQAIIDIGSNSMRLTLYEVNGAKFKIFFKEKIMAGLAGYIENGVLSAEGIECAYTGLLDFREMLETLGIERVAIFATASLRNIKNTQEAVTAIKVATGYTVEVIGGEEEASFGYLGAMLEINLPDGVFVDIGGASTEIVPFENGQMLAAASFEVGSLSLYRECVKNILPGGGSLKRIRKTIAEKIDQKSFFPFAKQSPLVCVGGTARAALKLARKLYDLPIGCHSVSREQLESLCALLYRGDRTATELVLKLVPDRIHTLIPGMMILQHICALFQADEVIVSKYGVREGYLCRKIIQLEQNITPTPKTEN
ncbi:MAG: hypothetical protein PHE47_05765 [Oscillospiraceae bacterium]|nr:hypothetical protein [Oscillospiraceae bacterium]